MVSYFHVTVKKSDRQQATGNSNKFGSYDLLCIYVVLSVNINT